MSCIDLVAQQYRALRCNHIATGLPALLAQAEANELSYLQLAEQLVALEIQGREKKRLGLNLKKAGFPLIKRLEEFDYRHQTTITKRQVSLTCSSSTSLATCRSTARACTTCFSSSTPCTSTARSS